MLLQTANGYILHRLIKLQSQTYILQIQVFIWYVLVVIVHFEHLFYLTNSRDGMRIRWDENFISKMKSI
jgi:hypothetical protein